MTTKNNPSAGIAIAIGASLPIWSGIYLLVQRVLG
jgi:hypothetical protein